MYMYTTNMSVHTVCLQDIGQPKGGQLKNLFVHLTASTLDKLQNNQILNSV